MNKLHLAILSGVLSLGATSASAQPTATPPSTAAALDAAAAPRIASGTMVDIEIAEAISTKTSKRGDTFAIRLATAVKLDGKVIVPVGTPGIGQVVDTGPGGAFGRPAKLLLAARYLEFDGRRLPLKAFRFSVTGADRDSAVLVASFVPYVGLLAPLIQGGEIDVPVGALAQAKLAAAVGVDGVPILPVAPAPTEPAAPAAAVTTASTSPEEGHP